jgi:hypothetical protein
VSLRSYLLGLVVVAVLPILALAAVPIVVAERQKRDVVEHGFGETAQALLAAVDREFLVTIAALEALATSEDLAAGDLRDFYAECQRVQATRGWLTAGLIDETGQQLFNLLQPFGAALPKTGSPELFRRVVETRRPGISNLFAGQVAQRPIVTVGVPVLRDGAVRYVLAAAVKTDRLAALVSEPRLLPGWTGMLLDAAQGVVARTGRREGIVGQRADPALIGRLAGADHGTFRAPAEAGGADYVTFSRSRLSGWTLVLSLPADAVEGPLRVYLWALGGGALMLVGGGIGLALLVWRRASAAIAVLSASAGTLGRPDAGPIPATRVAEVDAVAQRMMEVNALLRDETARRDHVLRELERTNVALQDSQRFAQSTLDALAAHIAVLDEAGTIVAVNASWRRFADDSAPRRRREEAGR